MKPMNCRTCKELTSVNYEGEGHTGRIFHICSKTHRFVDESQMEVRRDEDCPFDISPKDTASSKGFFLVKEGESK